MLKKLIRFIVIICFSPLIIILIPIVWLIEYLSDYPDWDFFIILYDWIRFKD